MQVLPLHAPGVNPKDGHRNPGIFLLGRALDFGVADGHRFAFLPDRAQVADDDLELRPAADRALDQVLQVLAVEGRG